MTKLPDSITNFLRGKRFGVAGVSRSGNQPANAIYRRLKDSGYEVFPINPRASEIEGTKCYPDVASLPEPIDGVVVATHPKESIEVVRQCGDRGIGHVWFHRSFGDGSVSEEAIRECETRGIAARLQ